MIRLIDRLALKHQDWNNVVRSFGASKETSEDVVQNMYIKMNEWEVNGKTSILYNQNEVNYYFIFKVLRTLFLDEIRKSKKYVNVESDYIFEKSNEEELDQISLANEMKDKIENLHWYDKRIFNIVCIEGKSMLQLSENTGISYHSIKRTIKKVKKSLI